MAQLRTQFLGDTSRVQKRLLPSNSSSCKRLPVRSTSLPEKPAFTRMPQELWHMIVRYLPSLTGRHAAQVFGFGLAEQHWWHSSIWDKIWEDNGWPLLATEMGLHPVLVGNLQALVDDLDRPITLTLLTGDKTGQIRLHREELLSSLRPHHLNERHEVVFHDSKIILNVDDALYNTYFTTLCPETLFTYSEVRGLQSGSIYWHDSEYALRTIGPEDVVGVGGPASTLLDISLICGITLTHPRELELFDRRQFLFQHPSCPPISPLLPVVYNANGGWVLGWEFIGDNQHPRWHT